MFVVIYDECDATQLALINAIAVKIVFALEK